MFTRPVWSLVLLTPVALFFILQANPCLAGRPAGWGGMAEGYEHVWDSKTKHGGEASGTIRSTAEKPPGPATYVQRVRADNYRGRRLRFSGYIKSEGADSSSGLWMRVDGQDVSGLAFDNMRGRKIRGTSDWVKCEIVLDVPQDAVAITLGASLGGKGQIWLDDLKLETVTSEVNSTDLKTPTRPYEQPSLTMTPKEIVNPDFEKQSEG